MKPTIGRIIHVYMKSEDGEISLGPLCARVVALRDLMVVGVDRPLHGIFVCEYIALPHTAGEKQVFSTLVSVPSSTAFSGWSDDYMPVIAHWEWPPRET